MASRILHTAIAHELAKTLPIKDKNRFFVGSILPDAVLSANKHEVNTHFIDIFDGGKKKRFDHSGFFDRYKNEVQSDELYLGYYFHLIEDGIFRGVLYYDIGLISHRGREGFVEELYRDYRILNGRITESYGLSGDMYVPHGLESERINDIYAFETKAFLEDMKKDFSVKKNEEPKHFTEKHAEDFIKKCIEVCVSEYGAIKDGFHAVGAYDYFWETRTADK